MQTKSSIDIYIIPCIKLIASGKVLYSTGSSAECSVMTSMGEMGEWGGSPRGKGPMSLIADSFHCTE